MEGDHAAQTTESAEPDRAGGGATLQRDPEVLRDIGRRFGGRLALNADVAKSGTVRVGDGVRLVRAS